MPRGFDTDAPIARRLGATTGHRKPLMLAMLAVPMVCSCMLGAFEMIVLVIPLVMPPLLRVEADVAWVAALILLVPQAGFLLPPFGNAVLMRRALLSGSVGLGALSHALLPQLAAQALLIAAVLAYPSITRRAKPAKPAAPVAKPADVERPERAVRDAIQAQSRRRCGDQAPDARASPAR